MATAEQLQQQFLDASDRIDQLDFRLRALGLDVNPRTSVIPASDVSKRTVQLVRDISGLRASFRFTGEGFPVDLDSLMLSFRFQCHHSLTDNEGINSRGNASLLLTVRDQDTLAATGSIEEVGLSDYQLLANRDIFVVDPLFLIQRISINANGRQVTIPPNTGDAPKFPIWFMMMQSLANVDDLRPTPSQGNHILPTEAAREFSNIRARRSVETYPNDSANESADQFVEFHLGRFLRMTRLLGESIYYPDGPDLDITVDFLSGNAALSSAVFRNPLTPSTNTFSSVYIAPQVTQGAALSYDILKPRFSTDVLDSIRSLRASIGGFTSPLTQHKVVSLPMTVSSTISFPTFTFGVGPPRGIIIFAARHELDLTNPTGTSYTEPWAYRFHNLRNLEMNATVSYGGDQFNIPSNGTERVVNRRGNLHMRNQYNNFIRLGPAPASLTYAEWLRVTPCLCTKLDIAPSNWSLTREAEPSAVADNMTVTLTTTQLTGTTLVPAVTHYRWYCVVLSDAVIRTSGIGNKTVETVVSVPRTNLVTPGASLSAQRMPELLNSRLPGTSVSFRDAIASLSAPSS